MNEIRVRYAPSPTGQPHIGNIRTAFFNWLYARHHGGKFVVRIEDTDQERLVEGAYEGILEALEWLDIDWDEGPDKGGPFGPYLQSERLGSYEAAARTMIENGVAYYCFCDRERLANLRKQQQENKTDIKYDRRCLKLSGEEIQSNLDNNVSYVIRFKIPLNEIIKLNDIVRDEVEWNTNLLDDFVLIKSDGFPTYHLANVVDDHDMEISHVLRAEEWLPSTPRHLLIYAALGYEPPEFGHLPMILGPDKSKLSKRHGATSILEYRDLGYLPEAVINFMVLLGWSIDDHTEIISRDDMTKLFDLNRVGKPAAVFNIDKLDWMNGTYIRDLPEEELLRYVSTLCIDHYGDEVVNQYSERLAKITPLIAPRMKHIIDAPDMVSYVLITDLIVDKEFIKTCKLSDSDISAALDRTIQYMQTEKDFSKDVLEEQMRAICEELSSSPRNYFGLIRNVLTGRTATPPLFDIIEILGSKETVTRLQRASTLF
ncbi:MAG: glutamate--tRNA ligase [Dehalococcoidia bacterium]